MIPLLRVLPTMIAGSAAMMSLNQAAALGRTITEVTNRNMAANLGMIFLKGVGTVRILGGTVQGAFSPLMKFLPHTNNGLETGLILKLIKKPGEAMTVITGPGFASVILTNTGYVVIAIIVYIIVNNVVRQVIKFSYGYLYYKTQHEKSQHGHGPGPGIKDSPIQLYTS